MIKEVQYLTKRIEQLVKIRNTINKTIDDVYDKRDEITELDSNTDLETVYENQAMNLENISKLLKKMKKECKEIRELEELYPHIFNNE